MIALLLATLPLVLQEPSSPVPAFDQKKTITASVLEEEIDRSVHWLRQRFDPANGSFGSLESDAWALLALAVSPRKYRASEGPFVAQPLAKLLAAQKPDGSFGDARLDPVAARALDALGEKERAKRVPGAGAKPAWQGESTPEAVQTLARTILTARRPDGSFGAVPETAAEIEKLSWCQAQLKASEP